MWQKNAVHVMVIAPPGVDPVLASGNNVVFLKLQLCSLYLSHLLASYRDLPVLFGLGSKDFVRLLC